MLQQEQAVSQVSDGYQPELQIGIGEIRQGGRTSRSAHRLACQIGQAAEAGPLPYQDTLAGLEVDAGELDLLATFTGDRHRVHDDVYRAILESIDALLDGYRLELHFVPVAEQLARDLPGDVDVETFEPARRRVAKPEQVGVLVDADDQRAFGGRHGHEGPGLARSRAGGHQKRQDQRNERRGSHRYSRNRCPRPTTTPPTAITATAAQPKVRKVSAPAALIVSLTKSWRPVSTA